jgi:hypothetical protein
MQWVNDLEVPYANYCRSFIPNLNQRTDILRNSAIQNLLYVRIYIYIHIYIYICCQLYVLK